jgi:hypothetical protein
MGIGSATMIGSKRGALMADVFTVLVRRTREIGIKGRSTMSKAQLIRALRDR